jgi:hypothetical protein
LTGAAAARTIIGRVSGITPSLESITQSIDTGSGDSQGNLRNNPLDVIGNVGHLFHHGGKPAKASETAKAEKAEKTDNSEDAEEKPSKSDSKIAKADTRSESKSESKKERKSNKKDKAKGDSKKDGDLSPAPEAAASKPDSDGGDSSRPQGGGDISFQLKGVSVTPRKSILAVTIHNSGSNNFSFSPDVISISDGSHKLSEAAVRADFDQTLVQPNGEVKGTITIFGRPWNERLAVILPDGSKNIPMRR